MKQEPTINKDKLKVFIESTFDLEVTRLVFVPEGEFAYSYIVETRNNKKYFVKLYDKSRLSKTIDTTLDSSLSIAYQLHQIAKISQTAYPIKTKQGGYKTEFDQMNLVMWTYFEGKIVNEKQIHSKEILAQLGELLGRIHESTDLIDTVKTQHFNFALDFRKDLLLCIKEVTECTTSKDKNYNKLQKLIKSNMNHILPALVYLEELSVRLEEERSLDLVICHTDPIRHNIILDKNNKINLVDWDGAILAPFEKDIWFYINEKHGKEFIQSYLEIRDIDTLDEDIVVFLFYHRTLEDLTDWIYRILFEETTQEQMRNDFKGLKEDIWPVLPNMKEIELTIRKKTQILIQTIKKRN